jgi:hypothetical protein
MSDLTKLQRSALEILCQHDRQHPITGRDLSLVLTGYSDNKAKPGANLRQIIHALRVKGFPICAVSEGYYYPLSLNDIDDCIFQLDGRIAQIQRAKSGMLEGRRRFELKLATTSVQANPLPLGFKFSPHVDSNNTSTLRFPKNP